MSDGGGMVNVRHRAVQMNYRGALYLLTGVGDIVYPGLALDGLQCKTARAGRGYEITAHGAAGKINGK